MACRRPAFGAHPSGEDYGPNPAHCLNSNVDAACCVMCKRSISGGDKASVVFKLLGAVQDVNAGFLAHKFVIGALISMLKMAPTADVAGGERAPAQYLWHRIGLVRRFQRRMSLLSFSGGRFPLRNWRQRGRMTLCFPEYKLWRQRHKSNHGSRQKR